MGRHSPADAELDRLEIDRLRARALELVAELDTLELLDAPAHLAWAWKASVILEKLARG